MAIVQQTHITAAEGNIEIATNALVDAQGVSVTDIIALAQAQATVALAKAQERVAAALEAAQNDQAYSFWVRGAEQ